MYEGFVTFGSSHLPRFKGNPMKVMLIVEGDDYLDARKNMVEDVDLAIGSYFAFQYDMDKVKGMEKTWGMKLYTKEEILKEYI